MLEGCKGARGLETTVTVSKDRTCGAVVNRFYVGTATEVPPQCHSSLQGLPIWH